MKHLTLVAVAYLAACDAPHDAPHDHAPEDPHATHEHALLGNSYFHGGCSDDDASYQMEMHEWGRIAAGSEAFEQCVQTVMTQQIVWQVPASTTTRGRSFDVFGPYLSCDDDPFANEPPAEQARRALIAARSPNDVVVHCSGSGAIASTRQNDGWNHRNDEHFKWGEWFRDVQVPVCDGTNAADCRDAGDAWPFSEGANTIWHEAMHTHGYRHHGNGDDSPAEARRDCGRNNTPGWHFQANSMPYAIGRCMEGVLAMSAAVCDIHACGSSQLNLIDGMGSNTCTCVTDPQDIDYSRVVVEMDYTAPYARRDVHEFYSGYAGLAVPLVLGEERTQEIALSVLDSTLPEPFDVAWRVERANGRVENFTGRALSLEYRLGDVIDFTVTSTAAYPAGWLPVLEYRFEAQHTSIRNASAIQPPSDLAQSIEVGEWVRAGYRSDGLAHLNLSLEARAECLESWTDDCGMTFFVEGASEAERHFRAVAKGALATWDIDWLPAGNYTWFAESDYEGETASASLEEKWGRHFRVNPALFSERDTPPARPFATGHFLHFDARGNADTVTLSAASFDLNGDPLTFMFEVRRFDQPFQDTPTHQTAAERTPIEGERSLHVAGEVGLPFDGTEHHWQVRVRDPSGRVSPWIYGGYYPDRGDITMVQLLNLQRDRLFDNPHLIRQELERDFDLGPIDRDDVRSLARFPQVSGLFVDRNPERVVTPIEAETVTGLPLGTSGVVTYVPAARLETVIEQTEVLPVRSFPLRRVGR